MPLPALTPVEARFSATAAAAATTEALSAIAAASVELLLGLKEVHGAHKTGLKEVHSKADEQLGANTACALT